MDEIQKNIIKEILNRISKVYKTDNELHPEIFFMFFNTEEYSAFMSVFGEVYSTYPHHDILCSVDYNILKKVKTVANVRDAFMTYTWDFKEDGGNWSMFKNTSVSYKETMENCVRMEFFKEKFPELYI